MKYSEALIAWTPVRHRHRPETTGQLQVGPLLSLSENRWAKRFSCSGGAAYVATRKLAGDQAVARLFIEFHTLVVRDGIDPQAAHEAFLAIDEYRKSISPDIEGANHD